MEARHVVKFTHDNGVKLNKVEYWCGEHGEPDEWHFLDAQHAALAVNGSIQPCKKCIKSIIETLSQEL